MPDIKCDPSSHPKNDPTSYLKRNPAGYLKRDPSSRKIITLLAV